MSTGHEVHVLFHDHCFDGLASAAVFTRFYKSCIDPKATFSYRGMNHRPGTAYVEGVFTSAPVHACVDFRYSPSDKLTWWFDHHASAFEEPAHEEVFRRRADPHQVLDIHAKSCTNLLARHVREKYGFDTAPIASLLHWAEIIDGALFPSARAAVALEEPALRLMLLAEATRDENVIPRLISGLVRGTLEEVAAQPWVQTAVAPLLETHRRACDAMRSRATLCGEVVRADLFDSEFETFNKFIAYDLFPEATYTLVVSRVGSKAKVSVGSNPWAQERRRHHIASICQRYGGGGHAAVGAMAFPADNVDRARQVSDEVFEILSGPGTESGA